MVFKAALFICAQALMIQSILGQAIGARCAAASLNGAYGPAAAPASHGGPLPTASGSPIPASGVSIASENYYEGPLSVAGTLPFLGTVALEGALPTAGSGAVAFGAGNGEVAMLSEDFGGRIAGPYGVDAYRAGALDYGLGARAYDAAYARPACGCSRL